jgi:hypothetical protein
VKVEDIRMSIAAVEKQGVGGKRVRKVMEEVECTKIKYTHSGHTLRHPFEHQLKY